LAAIGCGEAIGGETALRISAKAATDIERKDDAITDLNSIHTLADFDYLAHVFMPENAVLGHV
jgi:hypothetical protein